MMRGLLQRLHAWLERRAEHPSAPVRRTAQFLLLALPFVRREGSSSDASPRAFIERLLSSHRMQQYLARGRGPRYWIAVVARIVSLKASVNAKVRELNSSDHYAFVLRIDGAIDQVVLRNLVIWH